MPVNPEKNTTETKDKSKTSDKFKLDLEASGLDARNLPTQTFLVVSIIAFVAYYILVYYFIVPKITSATSNYRRLQRVINERDDYQEKLNNIETILADKNYHDNISMIDNVLYNANPYVEVYMTIIDLAAKHHLNVSGLEYSPGYVATPSASLVPDSNENYPITFNLSGTYADICAFLNEIEWQAPFNSVSSASINIDNRSDTAAAEVVVLAQYHLPRIGVDVDTNLHPLGEDGLSTLAALNEIKPSAYQIYSDQIDTQQNKINIFALQDAGLTLATNKTPETTLVDADGNVIPEYIPPEEDQESLPTIYLDSLDTINAE